ncbi:MAG: hypothetical protein R8K50_07730 [Mariprofundus sp.]
MNRWLKMMCGYACVVTMCSMPAVQAAEQQNWLKSGWNQLTQHQPQQALQSWQRGINAQPDTRLFAVLGVFQEFDNALRQLRKIGQSQQAFIIASTQTHPTSYYILSARETNRDKVLRQTEMADLKQVAGIKGTLFADSAKAFKHGAIATPSRPAVPATQTPPVYNQKQTVKEHAHTTTRRSSAKPVTAQHTSPLWFNQGWQKLNGGKTDQAMQIWQIGLNELEDNQLFISLGVFAKLDNAVAKARKIGAGHKILIAMRHTGKELYYVLSMNTLSADKSARQLNLATLQEASGITSSLLSIAAANFKNHLILSHYPEVITAAAPLSTEEKAIANADPGASEARSDQPLIGHFDISGNQQISTDVIILELAEFFDMANSQVNHGLIKQRIKTLYHDTGMNHVSIDIPEEVFDESVKIKIMEDYL